MSGSAPARKSRFLRSSPMQVREPSHRPARVPDNLDRLLALFKEARAEAATRTASDDPAAPYRALLAAVKGAGQTRPARRGYARDAVWSRRAAGDPGSPAPCVIATGSRRGSTHIST